MRVRKSRCVESNRTHCCTGEFNAALSLCGVLEVALYFSEGFSEAAARVSAVAEAPWPLGETVVCLALRVLASRPSTSANCSLVFSLRQGFDHERVEDVGLLAAKLVLGLVVGASFQFGSLSTGMILGPETGETVQVGWIVLEGDLGDEWPC